jgi:hypothetical protein
MRILLKNGGLKIAFFEGLAGYAEHPLGGQPVGTNALKQWKSGKFQATSGFLER